MSAKDTWAVLRDLLAERILVLDGAMGTMIQEHGFGEADFRSPRFADHGRDQVADYARRKGASVEHTERWLAANLNYEP